MREADNGTKLICPKGLIFFKSVKDEESSKISFVRIIQMTLLELRQKKSLTTISDYLEYKENMTNQ